MMRIDEFVRILEPLDFLPARGGAVGIGQLTADSRQVTAGSAFFAVTGYVTDGHRFIADAIGAGAVVIVCERLPDRPDGRCTWIRVGSCRRALSKAAAAWYGYPAASLKVVGVTGTNGKTTTARLMRELFTACGIRTGYIGTGLAMTGDRELPLERTTPEALELHALFRKMVDSGCESVVMEVSSHALVLHRTDDIPFYGAVFTNLTPEHLDFHGTMDAYGQAKQLLFGQVAADGFGIVNADDPRGAMMADAFTGSDLYCTTLSEPVFDCCGAAIARASGIETRMDGSRMEGMIAGHAFTASFMLPGRYNVMNMLQVYAAGYAMGIEPARAAEALCRVPSVKGRMQRVSDAGGALSVIVDYAHTPDALQKVLDALDEVRPEGSRLIVVFGCGGDRDRGKRPEMGRIAAACADRVIMTSDNPRGEDPDAILDEISAGVTSGSFIRLRDRAEAIRCGIFMMRPGDVLLVAGKGHEEYQEACGRKVHFSDSEVAQQALNERMRMHEKTST
ncbi:UDP-N-acetylmuramoyl-L-alanyl-D-glutamate--2,6-diaminopimelate ligase [Prosthecochloris sp. N3]|uniref:UDP-N-acetylmuramoyl-L-alanyl-D-glutamate--2,6-diaminopimelate ligase n=1 Tax=Prosthecochloris ethylica TaxID=2743976 RepID=A0ABR9XR94_9CHLB|nr:UDP-N-acetylmuramoyl-L-alanyl-D-glutamate--2,6-diaminopimelate ligase [Prosthecochloris ethylica]MBF0586096.1 UDP-N-acetylmuramoyl-L-alanyl-D-glutamate--2,6-diaminopimelate ligase [Prosthecochloris ethylica]MBF0636504.1 UDP-N-acetylmuramoyl-L-alanyl-D-glutamate--2,6-diaminopimelate ligase [Prosthecochloris ethylica]NUK47136.1 UDP-N-acetylmuramoyl-L-alanyl-D-glutamate--2,6-diaminopimelate ligase [Prosthecochloris ethylica]